MIVYDHTECAGIYLSRRYEGNNPYLHPSYKKALQVLVKNGHEVYSGPPRCRCGSDVILFCYGKI